MQTRKISRNWTVAAAVAAMLAASTASVRAQDNAAPPAAPMAPAPMTPAPMTPAPMTPAPMTPAPMTPAPMSTDTTAAMPMTPDTMSAPLMNYKILSNSPYSYTDLMMAKNRGLSDSQIATIAKIAKKTDMPFGEVSAAVERGETFPMLATEYGLNLADVYQNDKEKGQIADYKAAYESLNPKKSGMMMADMSQPMTSDMTPPMAGGDMTPPKPMEAQKPMPMTMPAAMPTMDIVDTAMAAKNLTTLVKALQMAGLVETLKGAGPFTVFAPDDKAFSKLPAGQLDALMADPAKLKMILTYHVIPASVDAATAMSMTSPTSPPTVEGATLQVTKGRHGKLMINDATVTKANIQATNGIIHIINKVLMPPMDTTASPATPDTTTTTPPDGNVGPHRPDNSVRAGFARCSGTGSVIG